MTMVLTSLQWKRVLYLFFATLEGRTTPIIVVTHSCVAVI